MSLRISPPGFARKIKAKEFKAEAVTTAYWIASSYLIQKSRHLMKSLWTRSFAGREVDTESQRRTVGPGRSSIAIKDNMLIRGEHCTCSCPKF